MAKKTIGELATLVTARVEPFKRGMKQASDHTKKFQREATGLTRFMDSKFAKSIMMGGAIGAGIAAANKLGDALKMAFTGALDAARTLFSATLDGLQEIDKTAKKAGQLGIDSNTLLKLEEVFGEAGAEDPQNALVRFQDTIGDLIKQRREGKFTDVGKQFMRVGLFDQNNDEFLNADLPEQLARFAEAIKAAPEAERTALIRDAFGRQGAQFRELLEAGGLNFLQAFDNAKGAILDEATIARVEKFNDDIAAITRNVKQFATAYLATAAMHFGDLVTKAREFSKAFDLEDVNGALAATEAFLANIYQNMMKIINAANVLSRLTPAGFVSGLLVDQGAEAMKGARGGNAPGVAPNLGRALVDGRGANLVQGLIEALDRNTRGVDVADAVRQGFEQGSKVAKQLVVGSFR